MADVRGVLQLCDPVLLNLHMDSDQLDSAESARMVVYLMDSRRVQKVLFRQLFVLDSMMSLLEGLESAQQLVMLQCPPHPGGGARGRWKSLKVQNRSGLEETEALLRIQLDQVDQIQTRRQTLTQLIDQLNQQRRQCDHLGESLQKAQNALQSCDHQLAQIRAELEAVSNQLINWQRIRDELQRCVSAAQDVMHINLLSFDQSQLCVALRPRPSSHLSTNQLEPLKLSVTWSHDDRFHLEVGGELSGLVEGCSTGGRGQLSAALLNVLSRYMGQVDLLTEIQTLRSSFAIDWRASQRLLVYLKSASLVYHLEVGEGYPRSGRVRLRSVRRDGLALDSSGLQPGRPDASLTEWLVLLSASSDGLD
ncbi:uncharacterized protein LOC115423662 [Sphaeramia orbicularis]|uniref:uncharacterized protein LOC115423662 n=1 Tax=Sphaeramia orbicularis TaxID=375764 RepID=UPI00117E93E7|nr:uncharacterized protein LOC115423662 [Sphaeramia orbicularis]